MPEPDPRFEVPPEYAAVYEQAFRRASDTGGEDDDGPGPDRGPGPPWWRRKAPRLLAVVALVLVVALAAFTAGRVSRPSAPPGAAVSTSASPRGEPTARSTLAPLYPLTASATCRQPDVTGEDGQAMSLEAGNVLDQDPATSWACQGGAVGELLVLDLPPGSTVTRVGLLPTSTLSGVGLNRIRGVDWIFDDGTSVHQDVDPGTGDGEPAVVQLQSVPATRTGRLRLRITATEPGPADLTAVASVFVSQPARGSSSTRSGSGSGSG